MREARSLGLLPGELSGQVTVVTGAGQGIGRELALVLGWMGAKVVAVDISPSGEQAVSTLRQSGSEAVFCQCDVADPVQVASLQQLVKGRFGRVDVLVNNAAASPVVPFPQLDVCTWDRVMAVNLRGTFLTCQAFLSELNLRQGVIINLVSANAMPGMTAYIASKQGIAGFSQSLAAEVGSSGARVIAFGPGMVATPGFRLAAAGLAAQGGATAAQILETAISAEHAAAGAAFLIARLAEDYHGEVVDVYTVLDRIRPTEQSMASATVATTPQIGELPEMIDSLLVVIDEMEEEFNRLPIFVRPIARSQFRSRSGHSSKEWSLVLTGVGERWQRQLSSDERGRLQVDLERLLAYCQAVPKETARFTKDETTLAEIGRITEQRVDLIRQLVSKL